MFFGYFQRIRRVVLQLPYRTSGIRYNQLTLKERSFVMLLLNAFSINMFNPSICFPIFREIDVDYVKSFNLVSAIGHADTAKVLSSILEMDIPTNRISVTLNSGDFAIVAQYIGPRLQEGVTQLPDDAEIRFYLVKMIDVGLIAPHRVVNQPAFGWAWRNYS